MVRNCRRLMGSLLRQRTRQPMTVASIGLLVSTLCQAPPLHAQKWNYIGADVILAKKFDWLVSRRNTLVSEGIDSLLPCRHTVP